MVPERTDGGHRIYSEGDLERLARLGELVDRGHRISQIAGLPDRALEEMVHGDRGAAAARERIIAAAHAMAEERQEAELRRAALELSASEFLEEVLLPIVRMVGPRPLRRGSGHDPPHTGGDTAGVTLGAAASYVAGRAIRGFTDWFLEITRSAWTVGVIAVRPTRGREEAAPWLDELSAYVAGVVLAQEGWDTRLIGLSLPGPHLASAVAATGARAVVFVDRSLLGASARGMEDGVESTVRACVRREGRLLLKGGARIPQLLLTSGESCAESDSRGVRRRSIVGRGATEVATDAIDVGRDAIDVGGTGADLMDGPAGGVDMVPGMVELRRRVRRIADQRRSPEG